MKTKSLKSVFVILLISLLPILPYSYQTILANPIPTYYNATGGIFPHSYTNLNVTMDNAKVNLNLTKGEKIEFVGIYDFYNSNNEDTNVTISAPFLFEWAEDFEYFSLKVDDIETPYNISSVSLYSSYQWASYIGQYYDYISLVTTSVTFAKQRNTTIAYAFEVYSGYYYGEVSYFVGTALAWNCNLSEEISFRVIGKQPTDQSSAHSVESISGGKIYSWKWVDTQINLQRVYLKFDFNRLDPGELITLIFIGGIFVICSPFLIMLGIKLAKHSKKRKASKANQKLE